MIRGAVLDQLRGALLELARSGAEPAEIAKRLDRFGWELDYLRKIVQGEAAPNEGCQPTL